MDWASHNMPITGRMFRSASVWADGIISVVFLDPSDLTFLSNGEKVAEKREKMDDDGNKILRLSVSLGLPSHLDWGGFP